MNTILYCYLLISLFYTVTAFELFGILSKKLKSKSENFAPVSDQKAQEYLQKFGYLGPSNFISGSSRGSGGGGIEDSVKNAIRKFQSFAGLTPTGSLDIQTKKKMSQPRCGVTDVLSITSGRESAFKWNKQHLTYSIVGYSSILSHSEVEKAMRKAFDTWSEVVPLTFSQVSPNQSPDIKIEFASLSHGDPWAFDGKGGVLAHATMPTSGLLHFDEDERWTFMNPQRISNGETDLLNVAIHESGHVLGLSHSRNEDDIMAPFYHETVDSNGNYITPKLRSSDIQAILDIYGSGRGRSSGSSSSSSRPPSNNDDDFWRPSSGSRRSLGGFGSSSRDFGRGFSSDFGNSGFNSWGSWGSEAHPFDGSRSRFSWSPWSSAFDDFENRNFDNRGTRSRSRGDESHSSSNNNDESSGWFSRKLGSFRTFLDGKK